MLRLCLALCLALIAPAAQAQSALQRLDTLDSGQAWDAVGRLELDGLGFCTGALVADDLVLTAAHCLYDRTTGQRIDPQKLQFQAGLRNGRAAAYRRVRRAVTLPEYVFAADVSAERVRADVALLELYQPIRSNSILPFSTGSGARTGQQVGVVSYALDRAEAPSLQEICGVTAQQQGVLVLSCNVDYGSSGAPVFSFDDGILRIVSVVSAKAEVGGRKVALGSRLDLQVGRLKSALAAGGGGTEAPAPRTTRITVGQNRHDTGAKFIRVED